MRRLLLASRGNKFALVLSLDLDFSLIMSAPAPMVGFEGVARALIPTIRAGRAVHESHGATAVVQN
jgi:nickel-dependent lactate racemase